MHVGLPKSTEPEPPEPEPSTITGIGIRGGRHALGTAAVPALAAQSRLPRHHAGQEAGRADRAAESAGHSGEEQQDGESVFRVAGQTDGELISDHAARLSPASTPTLVPLQSSLFR